MTPSPIATNQVVIQHDASITATDILNVINQVIVTAGPIVLQTFPPTAGPTSAITTVIGLSELGVSLIGQLRAALHKPKTPVVGV